MKNKNTTTADTNYYDAFINSILALPVQTRTKLLNGAAHFAEDNNPYLWLWEKYCNEEDSDCYLHALLDKHKLAID